MLDLKRLETFLWVARLNGFGAAADRLNTTQPAVSARIALLERDLGARLFDRRSRHIRLTPKGLDLVRHAERMLAVRDEILHSLAHPASVRSLLRIGVPETIVHTWLPSLVELINASYPSLTLEITVDSTPDLRAALLSARLDVAVLFAPIKEPQLQAKRVCAFSLSWVASPNLPFPNRKVSLPEIARWPIITFRRDTLPYAAIERLLLKNNLASSRVFCSSSIAAMVRMALDGIGPCVLPRTVVRRELREQTLREIHVNCELPSIEFYVCHKPADNYLAVTVAELALTAARSYDRGDRAGSKKLIEKSKSTIGRL